MITLDSEVRAEVSRLRASEKASRVIDAAFDEGRFAFVSGITRDECRFRNPARRNAWERGWLESERERAEHNSIKGMSESEKAEPREKLSALKMMIQEEPAHSASYPDFHPLKKRWALRRSSLNPQEAFALLERHRDTIEVTGSYGLLPRFVAVTEHEDPLTPLI